MKANVFLVLAILTLLCLVGWTVEGQKRRAAAPIWEYKVIDITLDGGGVPTVQGVRSRDGYESQLNQLGMQGWELVSEFQNQGSNTIRYTFKRNK